LLSTAGFKIFNNFLLSTTGKQLLLTGGCRVFNNFFAFKSWFQEFTATCLLESKNLLKNLKPSG